MAPLYVHDNTNAYGISLRLLRRYLIITVATQYNIL